MTPHVTLTLQPAVADSLDGLDALLLACHRLAVEDVGRVEPPFDADSLVLLAGLAFAAYQFDPADNHAWDVEYPGAAWRVQALEVDNYGALEALAGHLDVGPRLYVRPKLTEAVALVQHELEAGRRVIAQGNDGRVALVTALQVAGRRTERAGAAGCEAIAPSWELRAEVVADAMLDVRALVVVRPGHEGVRASRSHVLQRDVLAFGAAHAERKHELWAPDELFYATGRRALARTASLFAGDETCVEWARTWCTRTAWRRRTGAPALTGWADALDAGSPWWAAVEGGSDVLRSLAARLSREASVLDEAAGEGEPQVCAGLISGIARD